ncbi:hypothetical protein PC123_g796 [Phytophthora cactorum]|nr:hypothetical protein PC123_g796 [Phytophthora cactorum]
MFDKCMCPTGGYCEEDICGQNYQVIHKRVRKLKARETRDGSSNSDKRLKKWMKQFGDQPENVGRIFLDDVNQKKVA